MTLRPILAAALALAFSALASHALAQTSLDDPLDDHSAKRLDRMEKVVRELRAIVYQGRETGTPVVIQPAETENEIQALTDRLNDLEHTIQRLNGSLDTAAHDLDEARRAADTLRQQNAQLQDRLAGVEQKVAALAAPPPAPPEAAAPAAAAGDDAAAAFAAARRLLLDGDYAAAETAFSDFVTRYGDTPKGPEAHYDLGKTFIARKAWADAAQADLAAISGWPKTSWAPDAVLDLSRALVGIKKPEDACQTLAELARRYPKATTDVKNRAAAVQAQAKCSG